MCALACFSLPHTFAEDERVDLKITADSDLVILQFDLTSGTEYWIDESIDLRTPSWTHLFDEVSHAQSGNEDIHIPPHPEDSPARFLRLRYVEDIREAHGGLGEDELDMDAETARVHALQEALENEGVGTSVTIPDFPLGDYTRETHEEEDGTESIEIQRRLFFSPHVTYYYSPTNGVSADSFTGTPSIDGSSRQMDFYHPHETHGSTPGGRVVRFPGAVFTDADGNRTAGDIIVRGNVVRAGEYVFDFGSSALGWQPPSISARSWDMWEQMPQEFDPHPPECDDHVASIWNGPVLDITHTRLSRDLQLDWSIDEYYHFGVQHSLVYHCPNGPLERKVTVSFTYSIYVNGALFSYREAFYQYVHPPNHEVQNAGKPHAPVDTNTLVNDDVNTSTSYAANPSQGSLPEVMSSGLLRSAIPSQQQLAL